MFSISADFERAERMLTELGQKQLPFATAMALNETAEVVKKAEELSIAVSFDRPTPFTKKALYLRRATKGKLTATVGAKKIQADYLRRQVTGGRRTPSGKAIVVPVKARKNKYGNLPKGSVKRSLRRPDVFVASRRRGSTGHLAPGVYQRPGRSGGGLKLLASFEDSANYTAQWRFHGLAMSRARAAFHPAFIKAMKRAIETAK